MEELDNANKYHIFPQISLIFQILLLFTFISSQNIAFQKYLEDDLFELFPEELRPWNAMLLWGTKYSRSSLHMDPYNWTGTNAVIRGRKWWKVGTNEKSAVGQGNELTEYGLSTDCVKCIVFDIKGFLCNVINTP